MNVEDLRKKLKDILGNIAYLNFEAHDRSKISHDQAYYVIRQAEYLFKLKDILDKLTEEQKKIYEEVINECFCS